MIPLLLLAQGGAPLGTLDLPPLTAILIAVVLVFVNGFFVAAEFALVKVRPTQIDPHVSKRAGRVARHMISHLDAYLSATQLGITVASLGLGWIGEPAFAHLLEPIFQLLPGITETTRHTVSLVVAFLTITTLHIVLGELAPKSLAIRRPEVTSLWVALPLYAFYTISYPAIWLLNHMANAILRAVGIDPLEEGDLAHTEDEIRRLVASSTDSELPERKRELLDNIFELSDRVARQVMVPRAEVLHLDVRQPVEDNLEIARKSGHTRFPLCDHDLDHVLGLIHIKDVFRANETPQDLRQVARKLEFVPETLSLERLLRRMLNNNVHMAAVIDEYGSVSGLVTLENVIEEIVGQIQDEFDAEAPALIEQGNNIYRIQGSMLLGDLEDELGIKIDNRDEDTIAGIALSEIGRLPRVGDRARVGPLDLEVVEVDNMRIQILCVKILPDTGAEERAEART